ncbi:MAG: MATE family efflux transporter, partial [Gammaproteobacteria bacterium]|nr:MATE family efflux transporter [Gammaproteobacteria bacterium]
IRVVGTLGPDALAAVGAGQRVFFLMQALMMALSIGTTALVARAWGAGDNNEASRVTVASLVLASGLALPVALVGFLFASTLAGAFGLNAEAQALATSNIRWLSVFTLAYAVTAILAAALRATGDAWTPLWIAGAINLINIPLLYLLVFGYLGLPALGVVGVAVASGLAFTIGGLLFLALWLGKKVRLTGSIQGWWQRERLRRLVDIGYPAAVEQFVIQTGFIVFLMLIGNFYGTEAFAAYNVGVNILLVAITIGFGFSVAGSTLVGQHLGAGDPDGAARSGWRCMALAILAMACAGLLVMFFARELVLFFIDDPVTGDLAVQFIYLLGAMMPFMAVDFSIAGCLRGAGDTRFPLIATMFSLIGVRCGLAAVATWMELPVVWVYAALMGDYLVKASMLAWRFKQGRWKTVVKFAAHQG